MARGFRCCLRGPTPRFPWSRFAADVTPRALFALGEALRPLREDGVIVAGSGGIVHNLRRLDIRNKDAAAEPWATEFDEWVAKKIETRNLEDLFRYHTKAPNASRAVPTSEHFDPIFVTLGAAAPEEKPQTIYTGFHYGTISMRSFAFGASRQSGILPCFLRGIVSTLFSSMRSARMTRGRVSRGSMTSST